MRKPLENTANLAPTNGLLPIAYLSEPTNFMVRS